MVPIEGFSDKETAASFRSVQLATLSICLLALLFFIFFDSSKHSAALAGANPFLEDPYDAVGSFGIQLALLSALISFIRILRPYPQGIASGNLLLILRGDAVTLNSIVVTLAADLIAMARYVSEWTGAPGGQLLALLGFGLLVLTLLAGRVVIHLGRSSNLLAGPRSWLRTIVVCLVGNTILVVYPEGWRQSFPGGILAALLGMVFLFVITSALVKLVFPPVGVQSEDYFDDLLALYAWLKVKVPFAGFLFRGIEKIANTSWAHGIIQCLNPRKHSWNFVLLVALMAGSAFLLAEAIGEGAPNRGVILLVFSVLIGIEGAGVVLGYALFRKYLGIIE